MICGVLNSMAQQYKRLDVKAVRAVATAAVRDAGNQHEFLARASAALGADVEIISGPGRSAADSSGRQEPLAASQRTVSDYRYRRRQRGDYPERKRADRAGVFQTAGRPAAAGVVPEIGPAAARGTAPPAANISRSGSAPPCAGSARPASTVWSGLRPLRRPSSAPSTAFRERPARRIRPPAGNHGPDAQTLSRYFDSGHRGAAEDHRHRPAARRNHRSRHRRPAARSRSVPHARAVLLGRGCARRHHRRSRHARRRSRPDPAFTSISAAWWKRWPNITASRCAMPAKWPAWRTICFWVSRTPTGCPLTMGVCSKPPPICTIPGITSAIPGTTSIPIIWWRTRICRASPCTERELIANLCRYHRKAMPTPEHGNLQLLDVEGQRAVAYLIPLLRMADSLDRSHGQRIRSVECRQRDERFPDHFECFAGNRYRSGDLGGGAVVGNLPAGLQQTDATVVRSS